MSNTLHIQIALRHTPAAIFAALTDDLPAWFAEFTDVSVTDGRYDFWGRFTPEAPDRENGRHPLRDFVPGQRLAFAWRLGGADTAVQLHLVERAARGGWALVAQHTGVPTHHDIGSCTVEDFWFLSLENLRRHLDGKLVTRCDFSAPMRGDIRHQIEIDGPRAAVFDALIRPEQLNRWIASAAVVEAHPDGRYDLGWPEGSGALRILEIIPDEKLALGWGEGEYATAVTWTLAESGGKTRLTLVHSGFAPDQETGGLNAGWLNFMGWIRSLVEYGPAWQPPIPRLTPGGEALYAAVIGAAQADLAPLEG